MTKIEMNLIIQMFFIQHKGKLISEIIGYCNEDYGRYVNEIQTMTNGGSLILTEKNYVLVYGDKSYFSYIYSPLYQELSHDRVLNYINFFDLI